MNEQIKRSSGQKFGHLTILRAADKTGRAALCLCVCQKSVVVSVEALRSGDVESCGCRPLTGRPIRNPP